MSRILKSAAAEPGLSPFAFDDLAHSAREQLDDARRQATEILAAAHSQVDELRRRAEAEGHAAAQQALEQAVSQQVAAQVSTLLPALQNAIQQLETGRADCLARWESAALDVSLAIAERIARREIARDPSITLALVRESLELATGATNLQVRLHPDDLQALGQQVAQTLSDTSRLGPEAIVADATISRGGCRVETRGGSIDQQLEAQLARIAQELR